MRRLVGVLAVVALAGALVPSVSAAGSGGDVPAVTFTDVPGSHGGDRFSLTVTYSVDDHPTSFRRVPDEVTVSNGTLVGVRRHVRTGADRNRAWVLTVEPTDSRAVGVVVRGVSVVVPHTAPSAADPPVSALQTALAASAVFDADEVAVAEGSSEEVGVSISCPDAASASRLVESVDGRM